MFDDHISKLNGIKKNVQKGSGEPNRNKVGSVTMAQVEEIATLKMADLNAKDMQGAVRMVLGTARSMGLEVK